MSHVFSKNFCINDLFKIFVLVCIHTIREQDEGSCSYLFVAHMRTHASNAMQNYKKRHEEASIYGNIEPTFLQSSAFCKFGHNDFLFFGETRIRVKDYFKQEIGRKTTLRF